MMMGLAKLYIGRMSQHLVHANEAPKRYYCIFIFIKDIETITEKQSQKHKHSNC
jgi:hypothetical protein